MKVTKDGLRRIIRESVKRRLDGSQDAVSGRTSTYTDGTAITKEQLECLIEERLALRNK